MLAFRRMLPGAVAIDVPPDTPVAWIEAATGACEAALGAGRCMPAPAEGTTWRAVIIGPTMEAPTTLNIELYVAGESALESTRNLRFDAVDSERQRWASAGVVVAAMVSAREADRSSPVSRSEPAPTPLALREPVEAPPPAEPKSGGQVWFDGVFAVSSGLQGGSPALGGQLGVGARPSPIPAVVLARFGIASKEDPFEARWLTGALGAGLRALDATPLTLDVVPEFQLQHFRAQVTNDDSPRGPSTDAGHEVRVGGALEMALGWRLAEPFGVVLGGNASFLSPIVNIDSEGERLGRVSQFGWSAWAGLRWITVP